MSKYFVPVEIDGKWWVVEHIPLPDARDYYFEDLSSFDADGYNEHCNLYNNPPKYPTLESDSAYWASKAGVKMTGEEFKIVSERYPTGIEDNGVKEMAWEEPYAIPIQSPTTKELIEQEATKQFAESRFTNEAGTRSAFRSGFKQGATFALSLPKQDNGDEVYLKLILKIQSWVLDDKTKDTDKLLRDLKQHYSISKIK